MKLTHDSFGLLDMFMSEEELTVEIAQVDSVKINDVDVAEAGHDQIFEEFASYPASTNEENPSLV